MHTPKTRSLNPIADSRLIQILTGLLVIQLIVVGVVYFPKGKTVTGGTPLLGSLTADGVTAITVTDAKGNEITLQKQGDGWVLPDADDYPADGERVSKMLDSLIAIKTDKLITKTPASQKRLEVAADKFQRKVVLTTADGTQTVFIGTSAGAKATHVRLDGQNETFLTDAVTAWDAPAQASGWVKPAFVSVNKDDITAVTIKNTKGTLAFTKDGDGNWTLAGLGADEKLDSGKVNSMLTQASKINLNAPIGKTADPSLGLDNPQATVTINVQPKSGDAQTIVLKFGAKDDNNQYALQSSTSDYLVRVSGFVGDTFANKSQQDFIKQPPTPTPESK